MALQAAKCDKDAQPACNEINSLWGVFNGAVAPGIDGPHPGRLPIACAC